MKEKSLEILHYLTNIQIEKKITSWAISIISGIF